MKYPRIEGFVAATFTLFQADGSLDLEGVEGMAEHLEKNGVRAAFIGGTTGESSSLTLEERLGLTKKWSEVVRGTKLGLMVHVGSNCLADSRTLAVQAQELGAMAISAVAPSYFKPQALSDLIDCSASIAAAAPGLPFYHYDIPMLTGVHHSMAAFLEQAPAKIPNLAGIKYSNPDLVTLQECLAQSDFDVLWGMDEALLAAMALGVRGAVGSTYNFIAPIFHKLVACFEKGDLVAARAEQIKAVKFVRALSRRGYFASAKVLLDLMGLKGGDPRLPHRRLSIAEKEGVRAELKAFGMIG
jgi:N-acetylneuraminate lyase